jgi:hypothetical protein
LLTNINADVKVILGTPWLTNLSTIFRGFTNLEMRFQKGEHNITFSDITSGQAPRNELSITTSPSTTVVARQLQSATLPSSTQLLHHNMSRAARTYRSNRLESVDDTAIIFNYINANYKSTTSPSTSSA